MKPERLPPFQFALKLVRMGLAVARPQPPVVCFNQRSRSLLVIEGTSRLAQSTGISESHRGLIFITRFFTAWASFIVRYDPIATEKAIDGLPALARSFA